jgi:DNA polymerase
MADISQLNELISDVRERVLFLHELGVDGMDVALPSAVPREALPQAAAEEKIIARPEPEMPPAERVADRAKPHSRLDILPTLGRREPAAVPFPYWRPPEDRKESAEQATQIAEPTASGTALSTETIDDIRADIGDCTRCGLCKGRRQIVHTTGNFQADLMFVGEAPGADEDEQGLPFVGRAGQLLTKIIESIGMKREDVCIGNINRCRPPGNRAPEPEETAQCRPFILREIAVVKPKVIVVLGATAAHNLLQVKTPISRLRGQFHDYLGVKVMPTFHPAYLLRDPHKKREVWEDMKMVRDLLVGGQ